MVYALSTEYTSIRIRKSTREILERVLLMLEGRLKRRLDFDDVVRYLALRALGRRPEYILRLFEEPVEGHDSATAQRLLREERERDDRFSEQNSS